MAGQKKQAAINFNQFKKSINVMCMIYLRLEDFNNLLLVATDDSIIKAFYYNGNQFQTVNPIINDEPHEGDIKILRSKHPQYCMAWDDIHQMLYSGQRDGLINVWSLRQSKPVGFLGTNHENPTNTNILQQHTGILRNQTTLNLDLNGNDDYQNYMATPTNTVLGHKDIVTELLMLPKLQYLASCSLDRKLILWDTITGEQKRVYQEHTMGVVSMTFNSEHILLFSAGFDHDICVWNPYIDTPVFKVAAHTGPIVNVHAIDHTSQLISCDSVGIVKVWDIRTFECVQTVNVQENFESFKFNLSYMLPLWSHKRIMICGKQILLYEYDKNVNQSLADELSPLCCEYIHKSMEFYTPIVDTVKVWSALTGSVKHIFRNVVNSQKEAEITAFAMDLNQKRFLIGDSTGQVRVFNSLNGELMKELQEHPNSEILNILPVKTKEMNLIITVAANNQVLVHEDEYLTQTGVRRSITVHQNYQIQTAKMYQFENLKFLIIGLNKGYVRSYELDTGRPDASYLAHAMGDVLEIYTLHHRPYFFTTDNVGEICMWNAPPSHNKYQKCFEYKNLDQENNEPLAIGAVVYNDEDDILYIGDEKGYIQAFEFGTIFDQLLSGQSHDNQKHLDDSNLGYMQQKVLSYDLQTLNPLWKNREHLESVRSLKYLRYHNMKLLISTSFDRKIKIWNALTGEFIDSLRKGMSDESLPIGFKERPKQEPKHNPFQSKTAKKLVGIDLDSLKRKVDNNPAIERIRDLISQNKYSTEWKLFFEIEKVQLKKSQKFERTMTRIAELNKRGKNDLANQPTQFDIEMMSKMDNLYQARVEKSKKMSLTHSQAPQHPGLQTSASQPLFSMKQMPNFSKAMSINSGFMFSEFDRTNSIPQQIIQKLQKQAEEYQEQAPKRIRLKEVPESKTTQKLLYPSKFRKDPYKNKFKNQKSETKDTLPSIINRKSQSSGNMLMGMMGLKEKKFPREVSDAAHKLIKALNQAE